MAATDIPQSIGRYEVVRELGRGAVGRVFLARDPRLDRHVAVKTLAALAGLPPGESEQVRARFLREAQAAAALNHRNIVTIFDVGEEGEIPYIAMEYLEGTTLDRHTREGHLLPLAKVLDIGIQAALALDEAHRAGIVHRDIKPANIVMLRDGAIKVADFGLAKDPRTSLTSDQTLLGTPNYMSPEQIAGRDLDGRSDLFSLAVSVYELVAGSRPFPGDTISSVLYRIVNEPAVPILKARADAPGELEAFFERTLAKDPARRPGTGAAFADELRRALIAIGGVPGDMVLPPPAAERGNEPSKPRTADQLRVQRGDAKAKPAKRSLFSKLVALAAGLGGFVIGAWTAPLWIGVDPLGAARRPVEDWLGQNLGAVGTLLRTTAPELRVLVTTAPPGMDVTIEPPEAARFEEGGVLVVPEDFDDPITLRAENSCRQGTETLQPGFVDRTAEIATQAKVVTLPIASDPAGAQVRIGDRLLPQATPTSVQVEACAAHVIELTIPGRPSMRVDLAADSGEAAWLAAVQNIAIAAPEESTLDVPSAPYAVSVRIGGGPRGRAGERFAVPPGRRTVFLSADPHFYEETIAVDFKPGAATKLDVRYPELVECTFASYPIGATVSARREAGAFREIGRTGTAEANAKLVAGRYTIRFAYEGRGVVEREVTLAAGSGKQTIRIGNDDWPQGGKR